MPETAFQEFRAPEELRSTPRKLTAALTRRAWLGSPPFVIASCTLSLLLLLGAVALSSVDSDFHARLKQYLIVVAVLSPLLFYCALRSLSVIHTLRLVRHGNVAVARLTRLRTEVVATLESEDVEVTKFTATFVAGNGKIYERTFEDSHAQWRQSSVEQPVTGDSISPLQGVLIFYSAENPNDNVAINELGMWGGGGCFIPDVGLTVRYPISKLELAEIALAAGSLAWFVIEFVIALKQGLPPP